VVARPITVLALDPCPDPGRPGAAARSFSARPSSAADHRRRRGLHGKWCTETVYAITSLGHRQADPALLATWVRGHWQMGALHWARAVSFDEDRSQVRSTRGPQVMAAFQNLAINPLRLTDWTGIAAELRQHARRPLLPLFTLGLT
jgi:predicted transposase YbfD/YdcC